MQTEYPASASGFINSYNVVFPAAFALAHLARAAAAIFALTAALIFLRFLAGLSDAAGAVPLILAQRALAPAAIAARTARDMRPRFFVGLKAAGGFGGIGKNLTQQRFHRDIHRGGQSQTGALAVWSGVGH
jgi:hypothetical protein